MGLFGHIKKQLKRKMRLKRRWLTLGIILLAVGCGISYLAVTGFGSGIGVSGHNADRETFFQNRTVLEPERFRNDAYVTLRRIFICGEEERLLGQMAPDEIASLQAEHPDWELHMQTAQAVTFVERVDDLSEQCKRDSYMGIDAAGNLTLYRGLPQEDRAVKTFFQLDIEYLESSMPKEAVKELRRGIRVADLAEYNSVISTFSDYAVEEIENVMKPSL